MIPAPHHLCHLRSSAFEDIVRCDLTLRPNHMERYVHPSLTSWQGV